MNLFVLFGVFSSVRFFIFWFKYVNNFFVWVLCKVVIRVIL